MGLITADFPLTTKESLSETIIEWTRADREGGSGRVRVWDDGEICLTYEREDRNLMPVEATMLILSALKKYGFEA